MVYVIKRCRDGQYVARSGSKHSYTPDRQQAQEFRTLEEAKRNACGNEEIWREPSASWSQRCG